ncbi:hypothetical protein PFISCL1PPCAC_23663, partial [Pristionchus fissidentatus]
GDEHVKNEILPSLSSIGRLGTPTVFDLMVQMTRLSVEKCELKEGIPPSHMSVWDGTVPPESIYGGQLLRHLTTPADRTGVPGKKLLNWIAEGSTVDIRLACCHKIRSGDFVILRDVLIVKAYSIAREDGTRCGSPVWMLQARDIEVVKDLAEGSEELRKFREVSKRVCEKIIDRIGEIENTEENFGGRTGGTVSIKEKVEEISEERIPEKRKLEEGGSGARSKKIRLSEERTWVDELAERDEIGEESQQPRLVQLESTTPLIDLPQPELLCSTVDFHLTMYAKFLGSLSGEGEIERKVWINWMRTCLSFQTVKAREDQVDCCEGCEGATSLFVYIPIDNPLHEGKSVHLLIDVSNFRVGNVKLSWANWRKKSRNQREKDFKDILQKINVSRITVHRALMMSLRSINVFLVDAGDDCITVSPKL